MTKVAAPLTRHQADLLEPAGLLADDAPGLRTAWTKIEVMWAATMDRASQLPPEWLDRRVDDSWSFVENLRHLIFVTDAWIRDTVLEQPSAYDPIGVPPDFVTDGDELGLDAAARPSIDEVTTKRRERLALVRRLVQDIDDDELDRTCAPRGGAFTVLGAVQNVVFEEWAHHFYVTRDLAVLEARGA